MKAKVEVNVQPDSYMTCERCGKPLTEETRVWLELSCATGQFSKENADPLPQVESQGYFPFGRDCAKYPNKPFNKRSR